MSDDALAWPVGGADAFDERGVGELLASEGACVATEKHGGLLEDKDGSRIGENQEGKFPLHGRNGRGSGFHYENPRVFSGWPAGKLEKSHEDFSKCAR